MFKERLFCCLFCFVCSYYNKGHLNYGELQMLFAIYCNPSIKEIPKIYSKKPKLFNFCLQSLYIVISICNINFKLEAINTQ